MACAVMPTLNLDATRCRSGAQAGANWPPDFLNYHPRDEARIVYPIKTSTRRLSELGAFAIRPAGDARRRRYLGDAETPRWLIVNLARRPAMRSA
jgi:hypothetical protein